MWHASVDGVEINKNNNKKTIKAQHVIQNDAYRTFSSTLSYESCFGNNIVTTSPLLSLQVAEGSQSSHSTPFSAFSSLNLNEWF